VDNGGQDHPDGLTHVVVQNHLVIPILEVTNLILFESQGIGLSDFQGQFGSLCTQIRFTPFDGLLSDYTFTVSR